MEQTDQRANDTMGFCTVSDVLIHKSSAMLGVPSMDLGFFLGNRLGMVSVSVLECSVILGFFLEGRCAGNNLVKAQRILKGSGDDGGVDSHIFGGRNGVSRLRMP